LQHFTEKHRSTLTVLQPASATVDEQSGALGMKAFKDLFRDISGVECAMAVAVVFALAVIAASSGLRSPSMAGASQCCSVEGPQGYHGPRA